MWEDFSYCDVFRSYFSSEECEQIISLHCGRDALRSMLPYVDGSLIRDSDLFWISRTAETAWIFDRIWAVVTLYNAKYGFELDAEMGQLQLTRYVKGQRYNWHMDLGSGPMSVRKISMSVELSDGGYEGGGIEVFYGEHLNNKIGLAQGDMIVFPSFVMHRALPVEDGIRWSLVAWLTGNRPLQ